MIELNGQPAALKFTLEITRKDTGKVETYHCIGTPISEQSEPEPNPEPNPEPERN